MEAAAMALPLPEDALAEVLTRLPAGSLAASRCVCKAWRALVDARELLLPHALPHEPRVITEDTYEPDHVPYLVFDPAVSPHYEVFLIPLVPEKPKPVDPREIPSTTFSLNIFFSDDDTMGAEEVEEEDEEYWEELVKLPPPPPSIEAGYFPARRLSLSARWRMGAEPEDTHGSMEWPPSPCVLHVFSSRTRRWEERTFVREGVAMGTVKDMRLDSLSGGGGTRWRYGVYWQQALYIHSRGGFVMRLPLTTEGHTEWDFDVDDDILHYDEDEDYHCSRVIDFLGFHPYKEVVFLMVSSTAVAYHLKTSKIQWLGESHPEDYDTISQGVHEAFPYTPCLIGKLRKKLPQMTSA
ncbi:hypothetical protein PR202_gb19443 [Eleusine coracana subsp. coracana]|uniref:F-box domain-containing protein n=1 Tax=Eleusine coracana subsp. coracana TaxID=191504 RepID=A0AAV5F8V5_ELECO|nr:hypothetical protein PR202_gb19443 [Eleusine coracana subsp. coracana]